MTLMGTSASSGTVRTYLGAHAEPADAGRRSDLRRLPADQHQRQHAAADRRRADDPDADADRGRRPGREQGIAYRRPDSDEPGNRFRLYEVAGMPHNNSRDSPAFQNDPCTLPVTDFPAGAFTALGLNHLIEWIANGKTPPHAPPIAVDQDTAERRLAAGARRARQRQGRRPQRLGRRADRHLRRVRQGQDARRRIGCASSPAPKVPLPDATLKKLYPRRATIRRKPSSGSASSSPRAGSCRSTRTWSAATSPRHDYRERDGPYVTSTNGITCFRGRRFIRRASRHLLIGSRSCSVAVGVGTSATTPPGILAGSIRF